MKKTLTAVLALALALSLGMTAAAVVGKSPEYYVADYAGVLKQATKDKIVDSNNHVTNGLEALCDGAQVVVVTVEYLDGMNSEEYAMQLFNDWGVGSAEHNNGMLLLLATKEGKAWLTVGAGIDGAFTNNMVDEYFNEYFWGDFDAGDFDGAVNSMLQALFKWYADNYYTPAYGAPGDGSGEYNEGRNEGRNEGVNNGRTGGVFASIFGTVASIVRFALVIAVIVFLLIVFSATSDRRRYHSYYT
ncbi:MAG: TPM domain-containing protein, partial [Oscillospiraceae bacterium]|nr:TPM domain-containing protein [Oscillospiraceae bacterium]